MITRRKAGAFAACIVALAGMAALGVGTVLAQGVSTYPDRQIRIIVPYPPGGSTDPVARLVAEELKTMWGQPVIVDNRAGAAGSIGTDAVAKATPDGYTILFHTSVISTDPSFKKLTPYNVQRDLMPLVQVATGPYLLVTPPGFPVSTVKELIAYAKANPGKLNYGSAGSGSSGHLIGELFKLRAGIDMVHVPFRGGGPSIQAVMGGEIQVLFDTVSGSRSLVDGGQLKGLAVTSAERAALMPNMPTMAQSGMEGGFEQVYWLGFFAPAGTPKDVAEKLATGISAAIGKPLIALRLRELGLLPRTVPLSDFSKIVDEDIEKWRGVIRDAGIEPQ
jgi:tripartite-type tricarboxylate transporter receptor subunit TctC